MLVVALLAAAGCGGGSDSSKSGKDDKTATPSATATATATAESGSGGKVNVKRFNRDRLRLAKACRTLKDTPDDAAAARSLRRAAAGYLAIFKAAPDTPFKRNDKAPKATMRRLLVVTAAYLRKSCGAKGKPIAERMSRAAHKRT
jgi:hypothetical protein